MGRKGSRALLSVILILTLGGGGCPLLDWVPSVNSRSLDGWHISETSTHGNTQGWRIEDRAIIGSQDVAGNGGVLLTNELFGDFEISVEVNPDFGIDSGLFLRSTEDGRCYQVTIDHIEGGTIGGIYGEGTVGWLSPIENWQEHYSAGQWNCIRARVRGNPPQIDVWMNGDLVNSYQGDQVLLPDEGAIGLQVHRGDRFYGFETRFRNFWVRRLEPQDVD